MKNFFTLALLVIASLSLSAQDLRVIDKTFNAADRIQRHQDISSRTASCGPDTILYALSKSLLADTVIRFLGVTASGVVSSGGQRYEVPMGETVTVSGFSFFGYSAAGAGLNVDVRCAIYNADPMTGLPTGTAIAADTVSLDTASTTFADVTSYANFSTPVAMTQDYVISLENLSDSTAAFATNNWAAMAGQGEGLASLIFQGAWTPAASLSIAGVSLDLDWFIEPFVNYDITAGFTSDITDCLVFDSTYTFMSNNSPLVTSRFYNLIAFDAFFDMTPDSTTDWDFGDGSPFDTGAEVSHAFAAGNNSYTVKSYAVVIGYSQFCVDSAEATFDAAAIPVADFATTIDSANLTVTFASSSTDAESFSWDFGDGNTSTDENPTNIYATADSFTITLTVTSCNGNLTSTFTQGVNLTQPNVSIINELLENLNVYPNPTKGITNLDLQLNKPQAVNVRLHNLVGQQIAEYRLGTVQHTNLQMDLSAQQAGIYLVYIEIGGQSIVQKLQVK